MHPRPDCASPLDPISLALCSSHFLIPIDKICIDPTSLDQLLSFLSRTHVPSLLNTEGCLSGRPKFISFRVSIFLALSPSISTEDLALSNSIDLDHSRTPSALSDLTALISVISLGLLCISIEISSSPCQGIHLSLPFS
ncbi:hypothetical protein TorRG33x02_161560 [Trema orientale]|uniref:Uncharacterized protein n=1 Tax=Trema orientale TaxID=63057 RepID=A0A2P5ERE6_TREOI|nr:hypothetical protein TorRG33x02_161560 [Trema orientale]